MEFHIADFVADATSLHTPSISTSNPSQKTVVRAEPVYQKTGEPAPTVPEAATAELDQDVKIEITDELIDIVSQQDVQVFAVGADGVETNDMVSMAMMAAMDNQEPTVQVWLMFTYFHKSFIV